MPSILKIEPFSDYRLEITYSTGEIGLLDLANLIVRSVPTSIYFPLRDPAYFASVFLDYHFPSLEERPAVAWNFTWPNGLDFEPDHTYIRACRKWETPIPSDEEILKFGEQINEIGVEVEGLGLGWPFFYMPYSMGPLSDPDTKARYEPAMFFMGIFGVWSANIDWGTGGSESPVTEILFSTHDNREQWLNDEAALLNFEGDYDRHLMHKPDLIEDRIIESCVESLLETNVPYAGTYCGWPIVYNPAGKQVANFRIGYPPLWMVYYEWINGLDQPPRIMRLSDEDLLKQKGITYADNNRSTARTSAQADRVCAEE